MPEATIPTIFITAFLIAFTGAMMPGPLLAYTIGAAATYGFWVGPLVILGHAILELTLVIALVLGLSHFFEGDTFASIVGLVGGSFLMYMGVTTARQGWRKTSIPLETRAGFAENRRVVVAGIIVSISNPYWFIWWATIGITYLLWSLDLGTAGVASFFSGHILADLSWYAFIAFLVASGRKVISDGIYSRLLLVCGVSLIGLGGYFIASGIDFLMD